MPQRVWLKNFYNSGMEELPVTTEDDIITLAWAPSPDEVE